MLTRLSTRSFSLGALSSRPMATASALRTRFDEVLPGMQADVSSLLEEYGETPINDKPVTIGQAVGGARGVPCLVWETSQLDAEEGIRFRGLTIPECQEQLPGAFPGGEPLPESLLWLLLTGEVPTDAQAKSVTEELHARSTLPAHVEPLIRSLPADMHPMTQLSIGLMAMQTESKFAAAYKEGVHKSKYADLVYEDAMDVMARLPRLAALIYRCSFKDGAIADYDTSLDYSSNFARMLGYNDAGFDELMRLYLTIHSDHEGGNVSAHATHLVGSALSDPYLSFAAGLNGLAGPLHGLANQEVLSWILDLQAKFEAEGKEVNAATIEEFAWETLDSGKVIPGYGHAVLRKTDPRYTCQREFALKHLPDDPLFKIVSTIYEVVPGVLTELGKVANPWPNVDSHSGVLLSHYNFNEHSYYTVLFGVSRAIGALSQLVLDRGLGFPLERPKSFTIAHLKDLAAKKAAK